MMDLLIHATWKLQQNNNNTDWWRVKAVNGKEISTPLLMQDNRQVYVARNQK